MARLHPFLAFANAFRSTTRPALSSTKPQLPLSTRAAVPSASFSSTPARQARKKKGPKKDPRIRMIRYFLHHPKTPRPLRFSRLRALRHWTIHRAWMLWRRKQAAAHEAELERQYNSMREACEALRLLDEQGHSVTTAGGGKDVGRLYRLAMEKKGVWQGMPIEYARPQTDFPSRDGWFHDWRR